MYKQCGAKLSGNYRITVYVGDSDDENLVPASEVRSLLAVMLESELSIYDPGFGWVECLTWSEFCRLLQSTTTPEAIALKTDIVQFVLDEAEWLLI